MSEVENFKRVTAAELVASDRRIQHVPDAHLTDNKPLGDSVSCPDDAFGILSKDLARRALVPEPR